MNIGDRFGRLVIVAEAPRMYRKVAYRCVCDCGGEKTLPASALRSGNTKSCGCLHLETSTALCLSRTKHGHSTRRHGWTPTYNSWVAIKERCGNPRSKLWPKYGGAGILLCDAWWDFSVFLADVGERPPGTSMDRIDNNRGYEPGNVRWATPSQQRRNQKRQRLTEEKVAMIKSMIAAGRSCSEIGAEFGESPGVIRQIKIGKNWRDVEPMAA